MKVYTSIAQLIGNTPLLELVNYEKKLGLEAKLLAKLEYLNPAGSTKDRAAAAHNLPFSPWPWICHARGLNPK